MSSKQTNPGAWVLQLWLYCYFYCLPRCYPSTPSSFLKHEVHHWPKTLQFRRIGIRSWEYFTASLDLVSSPSSSYPLLTGMGDSEEIGNALSSLSWNLSLRSSQSCIFPVKSEYDLHINFSSFSSFQEMHVVREVVCEHPTQIKLTWGLRKKFLFLVDLCIETLWDLDYLCRRHRRLSPSPLMK